MEYFFIASFSFISILLGSFFTVLIYRVPLILQKKWNEDSQRYLDHENSQQINFENFNIFYPFSHCPNCQIYLTILQKIPLLSYFFLKRKCANCHIKISFFYPLIEFLTLITSLIILVQFGISAQIIPALILTWGLLILAFIDFEHNILPDILTYPLLWCGLILSLFHLFVSPKQAILGAFSAYLFLYILAKSYQCLIKIKAMGEGDFKCFALLGAWLGLNALPYILLIATTVGSLIEIILYLQKRDSLRKRIAFGPYLALSGWIVLIGRFSFNSFF